MPDKIVLNTTRFKGEYPFDLDGEPLTALEWRWVKKISGYLPLTIMEGWDGGDPDLFIAFAVVALSRAGRIQDAEALTVAEHLERLPADGTAIKYVGEVVEVEQDPPAEPAETPDTDRQQNTTGSSSSQTLDPQVRDLSLTGRLASVRSAT